MKKILYMMAVALLFLCAGCEERNPALFDDISGIYFNNLSSTMMLTDSIDVTFIYEQDDVIDVPVKVQLLGRPSETARPVAVTVSSDDAVEGTDYTLPEESVLPAGASSMNCIVRLYRTSALKKEKKEIVLCVHQNEYFDLPVTEMVQVGDTVSTLKFRILFSDMFTKAPAAWDENLVGKFSQQKFELICRVLDMDPADFNDSSIVTLAKLLYISAEMTGYVKGEVEKMEAGLPYDEDIIDMETGLPLNFGR